MSGGNGRSSTIDKGGDTLEPELDTTEGCVRKCLVAYVKDRVGFLTLSDAIEFGEDYVDQTHLVYLINKIKMLYRDII